MSCSLPAFLTETHRVPRRVFALRLGTLAWSAIVLSGCFAGRPVLDSEEARSLAEAVYTAATSKRLELLNAVEARLKTATTEGKVSPAASKALDAAIVKGKSADWLGAAKAVNSLLEASGR